MKIMKQSSIKGLFLPAIALCSLLLSGNAAYAALVTFTGNVSNVNGPLVSNAVNMTSGVSGSFLINDSTGVASKMTLAITATDPKTLISYSYTSSSVSDVNAITTVANNVDLDGVNGARWQLVTLATGPLPLNGYNPFLFDIQLDKEGGVFNNTDLLNPPSISSLTGTRWRLIFENAGGNLVRVQGALNSLTTVPLPAAVILFGAGLISLVGLGAGGLRNLRRPQA
ncbi:MAG TPA: hypothetical protein VN657_12715 [Nitrospiraceae bacterium]|nr:hypothetical protein [Nitrospiraceae bacterium]